MGIHSNDLLKRTVHNIQILMCCHSLGLSLGQAVTTQDHVITTQEQAAMTKAYAMMAQANKEVVPHPHQQVIIRNSRLRDFTQMNPPTFYMSKVDKDPRQFIDEVSTIILAMGFSTSEKVELATYKLKDVAQEWICNRGIKVH